MISRATVMDKKITPARIQSLLLKTNFSDPVVDRELKHLQPAYPVAAQDLNSLFKDLAF